MMDSLFFELIQVALGNRVCLSHTPSANEWAALYDMAKKQSLVGVCFAGVQRLCNSETSDYCGMSEMMYLTWMGMTAKIQQKNQTVDEQCVALQKRLAAEGIRSCVLKGQGVGQLYAEHLLGLRQSGDIDIYVDCGREKAIDYARSVQKDVDWDYKHLHLKVFEDTEVEMHYVPEVFLNLRKNKRLQVWFKEHREEMFAPSTCSGTAGFEFATPGLGVNLFYILLHTYRHFLYEGVGLRQLMDYYFVLSNPMVVDNMRHNTMNAVESFGMNRFTAGVMWIMKDVFGINESCLLCPPDEKEGKYILEQVMAGGNFGKHDERLANASGCGKLGEVKRILSHNMHLLAHYPADTIWAPIWIVYHWCWKRCVKA